MFDACDRKSGHVTATRTITGDPVTGTQQIEMTFSDDTTADPTDGLTRTETEFNRFHLTEGDPDRPLSASAATPSVAETEMFARSWTTSVPWDLV